ncbi:ATP-binding protein [Variovorax sp. AFSI2.2]|uniref:ATP-binding protein n=1 Tax=Variovorax sp. AFSI2.2 TaxID=3384160 RepID=UPI003EBCA06B
MTQFNFEAANLPEYEGNPFIAKLPPILSMQEWAAVLRGNVIFDPRERNYPAKLRKHCVMRLLRYFEPMDRQIRLAERLDMMIRQGYMGRNPAAQGYAARLAGGVRSAIEDIEASNVIPFFHPTALSFALTGCSGVGKTRAEEQVLLQYPQIIVHPELNMVQLVWLKLESPQKGGPKQLCIDFFTAVDQLLGTKYFKLYGKGGEDEMVVHMAQVATLHGIGLLVIDEIQHLKHARSGAGEEVLSFLVKLVNTIGIPVELIGTPSAVQVLQGNFRQGRRSSGLGALHWDPMPKDEVWEYFLQKMWTFQWTRNATPLTQDLSNVLHDESQGVTDLVVKMFMLAQMRLISIGETRPDSKEIITPNLIRRVAREDFWLVAPMIQALRLKDSKALVKYDDLQTFQIYVGGVLQSAASSSLVVGVQPASDQVKPAATGPETPAQKMVSALQAFGVSEDIAKVLVESLGAEVEGANPLDLLKRVAQQIEVGTPEKAKTEAGGQSTRAAKATAKVKSTKLKSVSNKEKVSEKDHESPQPQELQPTDLRYIVAQGATRALSPYQALCESRVVVSPVLDLQQQQAR